jgi:hypothetical protein
MESKDLKGRVDNFDNLFDGNRTGKTHDEKSIATREKEY